MIPTFASDSENSARLPSASSVNAVEDRVYLKDIPTDELEVCKVQEIPENLSFRIITEQDSYSLSASRIQFNFNNLIQSKVSLPGSTYEWEYERDGVWSKVPLERYKDVHGTRLSLYCYGTCIPAEGRTFTLDLTNLYSWACAGNYRLTIYSDQEKPVAACEFTLSK